MVFGDLVPGLASKSSKFELETALNPGEVIH